MDELIDNGKNTKCIKVFDNVFFIESIPRMNGDRHVGWDVKVTCRTGGRADTDKTESYTEYTPDRISAEEACFGYFLIEHCSGGIFWKEVNFPEQIGD